MQAKAKRCPWRFACLFLIACLFMGLVACVSPERKKLRKQIRREAERREQYAAKGPLEAIRAEALDERLSLHGPRSQKALMQKVMEMSELGHSPMLGYELSDKIREDYASYLVKDGLKASRNARIYYLASKAPLFQAAHDFTPYESPKSLTARLWTSLEQEHQDIGGIAMVGERLLLSDRQARCLYLYDESGKQVACIGRNCEEPTESYRVEKLEEALGKPPLFLLPSTVSYHPASGRIYVIDEGSGQLLILDQKGLLQGRHSLPSTLRSLGSEELVMDLAVSDAGELYLSFRHSESFLPALFHLRENGAFHPIGHHAGGLFFHQGEVYGAQEWESYGLSWSKNQSDFRMAEMSSRYAYLFQMKAGKAYIVDAFPAGQAPLTCLSTGEDVAYLTPGNRMTLLQLDEGRVKGLTSLRGELLLDRTPWPSYVMAGDKERFFVLHRERGEIYLLTIEG